MQKEMRVARQVTSPPTKASKAKLTAFHLPEALRFLDYVDEVRREYGNRPLFPMVKPDRDGRRDTPASNRVSK